MAAAIAPPERTVAADRDKQRYQAELGSLRRRYDESLKTIAQLEQDRALADLVVQSAINTYVIEPRHGSGTSEATPVLVASDWHVEERVDPRTVSGLNEFNLEIAQHRAARFFTSSLRLIRLLNRDVKIDTVVLALLGDFISNDIHDEVAEMSEIAPMHAITTAQSFIASGIEFLLNISPYTFVIPCHSGNHGRTTKTTRFAAENGHSLEYLMYRHLATHFRNEPRVQFQVAEGMHSYLDIYDQKVRFHHGHAIKYGGGVGGIFIPTFKAISQWNKAKRVDLDVFGHFHQTKDGGNFLCNGSLIGYNAFALSIKADYESPRQTLFLVDKKRGRTATWPIFVGEAGR